MKHTDLPQQLQTMLQAIPYVTIATVCSNGQPWNSPVVGRFDDELNLYWVSWKENQHSRNIALDPRIFVVVYDSRVPEGLGLGLFLQMRARALETFTSIERGLLAYDPFFSHSFPHQQFIGACPQRLYEAVPERAWYNIDGERDGHFVDLRCELRATAARWPILHHRGGGPDSCRG